MEKAKAELSHGGTVRRDGIIPNPKKKLLDQVREVIRLKHYSLRTEQCYVDWIKRFIVFHREKALTSPRPSPLPPGAARERGAWRHPRQMGAAEIESFLTDLAVRRGVAASTQNQAHGWMRVEG